MGRRRMAPVTHSIQARPRVALVTAILYVRASGNLIRPQRFIVFAEFAALSA